MDKGIKSLSKQISRDGPPHIRIKDPFAHMHPRRMRSAARLIYSKMEKDNVSFEQIKEMAQSGQL